MDQSPKRCALRRKAELFNERSSWVDHWREISTYQQPRLGRFLATDRNNGGKRYNSIYDNTAIFASRTLAAGMMSGMTSPARPWFRLALSDRDLMEFGPVKTWLHRTGLLLREIFAQSNTYRALHAGYEELGLFGTWSTVLLPDFETVLHHYPLTVGEYAIGTDHRGIVNTLAREFQMTVGQLVGQFGRDRCSDAVKTLYDRGRYDAWVDVVHVIEPNTYHDPSKRDNRNMRYASRYIEPGNNSDILLSDGGFKRFAALAPRWAVAGSDIYGTGPGMEALGDVKQLQHQNLRKAQGIDYQTNPPIQVPTAYKEAARNRLPGGVMYVDTNSPTGGVRTAFEVNLNLQHLMLDIQDVRDRIKSAYYADLFLMLANDTRSGITATEVAERHEEKLLMLGPVLERLHNELLSPQIDLAFDYAAEAGILPPVPEELQGVELNIEFVSTLAQAQRAVSAGGMDRLIGTITSIAAGQGSMNAWDKLDTDKVIDEYGDFFGVNPEIIRPTDVAQQIRGERAQAAAAQQAAAAMPAAADTAKTASEIDTGGLRDVINQFQGYTTA